MHNPFRHRPALLLGISGLAGCIFTLLLPAHLLFVAPCVLFGLWLIAMVFAKKERFLCTTGLMCACLFAMGLAGRLQTDLRQLAPLPVGEPISVTATAVQQETTHGGNRYLLMVQELNEQPCPRPLRLSATASAPIEMFVPFQSDLLLFEPEDALLTQLQQGGVANGYLSVGEDTAPIYGKPADGYPFYKLSHFLKQKAKGLFLTLFPQDSPLILAIVTGDTSLLTPAQQAAFARCGITHIFSVSGLHLSVIVGALAGILRQLGLRRKKQIAILLPALWAMVLLAGCAPSALRSGVMLSFTLFTALLHRKADSKNLVGFALFVMLCCNPALAADGGFLLSVTATLGMLFFSAPLEKRLLRLAQQTGRKRHSHNDSPATACSGFFKRLSNVFSPLLAVTLAATLATLPLLLLLFDQYSLAAPLANLLLVPFATPLVALGLLLLLGSFLGLPTALLQLFALPMGWLARLIDSFTQAIACLPVAEQYPSNWLLLFLLFVLYASLLFLPKINSRQWATACLVFSLLLTGCSLGGVVAGQHISSASLYADRQGSTALVRLDGKVIVASSGMSHQTAANISRRLGRMGKQAPDVICLGKQNRAALEALQLLQQYAPCPTVITTAQGDLFWTDQQLNSRSVTLRLRRMGKEGAVLAQGKNQSLLFSLPNSQQATDALLSEAAQTEHLLWLASSGHAAEQAATQKDTDALCVIAEKSKLSPLWQAQTKQQDTLHLFAWPGQGWQILPETLVF